MKWNEGLLEFEAIRIASSAAVEDAAHVVSRQSLKMLSTNGKKQIILLMGCLIV